MIFSTVHLGEIPTISRAAALAPGGPRRDRPRPCPSALSSRCSTQVGLNANTCWLGRSIGAGVPACRSVREMWSRGRSSASRKSFGTRRRATRPIQSIRSLHPPSVDYGIELRLLELDDDRSSELRAQPATRPASERLRNGSSWGRSHECIFPITYVRRCPLRIWGLTHRPRSCRAFGCLPPRRSVSESARELRASFTSSG